MKITLKALGDIADGVMERLGDSIGGIFHCPVETKTGFGDLAQGYNAERKQYFSSQLLASLGKAEREKRIVGVADVDLYVPRLNFVFGVSPTKSEIIGPQCP
mgnify:CR=1 FL=1